MREGMYERTKLVKSVKPKILLLLLVLLICGSIGGTSAWLVDLKGPLTNTFTIGDINISLSETGAENGTKSYKFMPGDVLVKDPKVTVAAESEACYLFIKVVDENNTSDGLDGNVINWAVRESETEWIKVAGHSGYWYRKVDAETAKAGASYYVLSGGEDENTNGQVTVNENVTKDMAASLKSGKPQIIITAAAVQMDNVATVTAAWDKLPAAFTGSN